MIARRRFRVPNGPIPLVIAGYPTPKELFNLSVVAGEKKARNDPVRQFVLATMAGIMIGVGALLSVMIGSGLPNSDKGVQKLASGMVFPVGLLMVVLTGSELATGDFMLFANAFLMGRISALRMVLCSLNVLLGNFLGSLGVAYVMGFAPDLFEDTPFVTAVQAIAYKKSHFGAGNVFLLGIGCNFLVCIAVFTALGAKTVSDKFFCVWPPVMAFVSLGFEHSVANMTFGPLGMLYGADVTFWRFFSKNLVPAILGNIFGAVVLVSGFQWYCVGYDIGMLHYGGLICMKDGIVDEIDNPKEEEEARDDAQDNDSDDKKDEKDEEIDKESDKEDEKKVDKKKDDKKKEDDKKKDDEKKDEKEDKKKDEKKDEKEDKVEETKEDELEDLELENMGESKQAKKTDKKEEERKKKKKKTKKMERLITTNASEKEGYQEEPLPDE